MSPVIRIFGLACLLVSVAALVAVEPAERTPAEWVKLLGDRDYRTREEASKKLWEMGESARTALEEGLKSPSLELSSRAKKILDKFNRGILPNTSKEMLALIDEFLTGNEQTYFNTAKKFIDLGPKGVTVLGQQLRKEFGSPSDRYEFFRLLQSYIRHQVPLLLFEGKEAEAEQLLRLLAYGQVWLYHPEQEEFAEQASGLPVTGQLDYAVFMARRGKRAELVQQMLDLRGLPGDLGKAGGSGLLCAYRMAGERTKLKALIPELTEKDKQWRGLREGLLIDMDDWSTLAAELPQAANSLDGLKAFRLRMAGKVKEANDLLAEVKSSDVERMGGYAMDSGALALLLNNRTDDGIARLKATQTAPHVLTDMLSVRLEFKESMDVITAGLKAKPADPDDEDGPLAGAQLQSLYLAKKGRLLAQIGQRDSAAQVFSKMADELNLYDRSALLQLVKAEVRSGFPDLAAELLGRAQSKFDTDNNQTLLLNYNGQDPYEILFDADSPAAFFWWHVLKETRAKEEPGKRMRTIRHLLSGRLTREEVKTLLTEAGKAKFPAPRQPRFNDTDGFQSHIGASPFGKAFGIATAQRIAGDVPAAIETLTKYLETLNKKKPEPEISNDFNFEFGAMPTPGNRRWVFGIDESFRLWLDLSEMLIAQKKPREAAEVLLNGWRRNPNNGLLLYYSGKALVLAGDEKEGKRRMTLSHEVPLADTRYRGRFLEELLNRGEPVADIRIERDATQLAAWLVEGNNGNIWNQIGRASAVLKDYAAAAAANRRAIHYVLRTRNVSYVEGQAYVNVLASVRGFEARQLLADGKTAEALAAGREALSQLPTLTDLTISMVQSLDKMNRKADADALFRESWDVLSKVAKDYPDSGWARHSASWLASGCRRNLDAALEFSKKAVELEPETRSYRSGLAEIYFRKGDRPKALELMTKLSEEDRRNNFFVRQLARYKSAPFDSPLPDNDDD